MAKKRVKSPDSSSESESDYESKNRVPKREGKTKRPLNKWAEAVKRWNSEQKTETYRIPRKGSPEYDRVKAIMATL